MLERERHRMIVKLLAEHSIVSVTELVGWEHSAKNELILGKRVQRYNARARADLRALLDRFQIEPAIVRALAARGLDPRAEPGVAPIGEPQAAGSEPAGGSPLPATPDASQRASHDGGVS